MKNIISGDKIKRLRDLVNSRDRFVYKVYNDKGGKNLFNLVCSAMDWISVSIRHLESAPELDRNIDIKSMQVYSLISSIDLIFESIKQLHRVFIIDKKDPFYGEKKCFKDRLFANEDDNTYFKTIRACFGAHPVNLNQENSKRFASWPFPSDDHPDDLIVRLYSRDVGKKDLTLNLSINELFEFARVRYEYLDVISDRIETLLAEYKYKLSMENIETKSNPLEQLHILRAESKRRLDCDCYNEEIDNLIITFETKVTDPELTPLADKYKKSLLPLIEEIKSNLQKMNLVDLKNNVEIREKSDLQKELDYEISKFYTWFYNGGKFDPLLERYFNRFNNLTSGKLKFTKSDDINLTFLKVKIMLSEWR